MRIIKSEVFIFKMVEGCVDTPFFSIQRFNYCK